MKNKAIIFLIILTLVVGGIGWWHYQNNLYSKEVLRLEILGPENADLAQEVEYIVKYKHNGNTRLEDPQLVFDFPSHSLPEDPAVGDLRSGGRVILDKEDLGGAIYPGEEKSFSFKARLFGKESEALQAQVSLSYQPKNLTAYYESSTTLTTVIEEVPLTLEFDLSSKIESGEEIQFRLNYFSNVDYSLSDLRVKIEYPSGFELIEASPSSIEKDSWDIPGVLNKAQGGRIEIEGIVTGEVGEQKIFKGKIGIWQEDEFVLLKETTEGVEIVKPSLYISQQINNNPEYVASLGDLLHYEVIFKNVGEEDLTDLFLIAKLEGGAFELDTLKSESGDFETGDNSIVFDWRRNPSLQLLSAQEEGKVEYWVKLKDQLESGENLKITNRVYIGQTWKEFETKINSELEIVQKGYFEDEVFGNSGPVPPEVGETTTYTVIWQAESRYNDVGNVKVKAVLPEESAPTGMIFPEEEAEKFAFDSESREIVWSLDELKAGEDAHAVAFQISFRPGSGQEGQTPEIIGEARITGEDQWTDQLLEGAASGINTDLPDDETVGEGAVQ